MNTILLLQKLGFGFVASHAGRVRNFLLAACTFSLVSAYGQNNKVLILADKYFAAGEYYTAAGLYGQFLNPSVRPKSYGDFPLYNKNKSGTSVSRQTRYAVSYKQAESYRLSHYWQEAAALYQSCYQEDSIKYEAALYWYAVCQRSLGHYDQAYESLLQYLSQTREYTFKKEAEREMEVLKFINNQLQRPDTALFHVLKLTGTNLPEKGFFAPVLSQHNQLLFTSAVTDSIHYPASNPNHNRLFFAEYRNGGLENITPLHLDSLEGSWNQGTGSLSADGNYLYFSQWKNENGKTTSSIFYSKKNGDGWSQPVLLNSVNEPGSNAKQPFCTPDGKYLYFASDRKGGQGGFDIWYAPLQKDGTTERPLNAGAELNTEGNEQAPFYHTATHVLVFASDQLPGMGGYDLFMAEGGDSNWQKPVNMGYPVNSNREDIYFFTTGKNSLLENALFSSDRGNSCCLSTYSVTKTAKNKILTGLVRDCKDNQPLANADVILRDATGRDVHLVTNNNGIYQHEITEPGPFRQVLVSKEKYEDHTSDIQTERTIETNWKTDTVYNTAVCLEKKLVIKVENVVTVYFDFDKSNLKDRAQAQLDSIYNVLVENPQATLQVSGYTDGLGSVEYNKKLSDRRAKSCADYLIGKGIDPARISFESFGACCPVEMELINGRDNPDGRSMNRRALINISKE